MNNSKSNNMNITSQESNTVTETTYFLEDNGKKLVYKEWLNQKGKVIDEVLRDQNGNDIDDPALLERVQEAVDAQITG